MIAIARSSLVTAPHRDFERHRVVFVDIHRQKAPAGVELGGDSGTIARACLRTRR
jgi:hypothetical protein